MLQHVLRVLPEEACGLIGGQKGVSRVVYEVENVLHSPTHFRMEPEGQVRAFLAIEQQGLELLAIYHSHPLGPDKPSPTDMSEFAYPGTPYLIWYPQAKGWVCKAFMLLGSEFTEIELILVEE